MAAVRAAIRRQDSGLALQQVRLLQEWLAEAVAPNRLMTTLAAIFAMSALLLASIGVFGVLASMVASRTREIGVRMAIGATPRRVMALVLRESMTWAASGMLAGLAGAYAAGGLIAAVVFDVPPNDPATFALVGGVVTAVAVLASVVPVARAVRIDPTIAIRTE
jgi:ABC-type antimicrobial peptide transport system permease subunit